MKNKGKSPPYCDHRSEGKSAFLASESKNRAGSTSYNHDTQAAYNVSDTKSYAGNEGCDNITASSHRTPLLNLQENQITW